MAYDRPSYEPEDPNKTLPWQDKPASSGNASGMRERLAKALWDHEIACSQADDKRLNRRPVNYVEWPVDSAIQPYCQSTYRTVDALLAAVPSLQAAYQSGLRDEQESKWVSVEERLPESGIEVLTATYCQEISRYIYRLSTLVDEQRWFSDAEEYHSGVTHWQLLPAPPEEK